MKSMILFSVGVLSLVWAVGAQESAKPPLRKGVSVQMAVANHAVEMRGADEEGSTVVAITAAGDLYVGVERSEPSALSSLRAETIYVKADSRVPFQKMLTVLDALRGKTVVLLAASPANVDRAKIVPPYGVKLNLSK